MAGGAFAADYTMRANSSANFAAEVNPSVAKLPSIVSEFFQDYNREHAAPMMAESVQIQGMSANLLPDGMAAALEQAGNMDKYAMADVAEHGSEMGTNRGGSEHVRS